MSTSKDIIADILAALAPLQVRARSMFGEYGFYCDEKIVALVCDDRFYLKPSAAVDALKVELESCPPYPGAKDYLILDDRFMQDRAGFKQLVQATADALPAPKPKKKSKRAKAPRKKS
jgi:TfoX/Sxy family transcriptional regulator of competence genes